MGLKHEHEQFAVEPSAPPALDDRLETVLVNEEEKSLLIVTARDQSNALLALLDQPSVMETLPAKSHRRRRYLHALTNGALVQELLYLFFQYAATQKGLINAGVEQNSAAIAAACLSLSDWFVNVLSVSVPADADSVLFPVREQLLGRWAKIEFMIKGLSLVGSYSFGAAADALPLLALLPNDWLRWQAGIMNYALVALNILTGASYYRLFNHTKIAHHIAAFKDFCDYPSLPMRRMYQKPLNMSRYLEVMRSWLTVIGYRSLSFAFIAQALAPYLLDPMAIDVEQQTAIGDGLALFALGSTALNVLFSRVLPTYEQFSDLAYDVVRPDEYQAAAKAWDAEACVSKTAFMQRVSLLMICALPNMLTAAGWALLTRSLLSDGLAQQVVPALVGSASLFNRSYVEYQAFIAKKAVAAIVNSQTEIPRRLFDQYGLIQPEHRVVVDAVDVSASDLSDQLKQVNQVFQRLSRSFAAHNRLFDGLLMTINIGARTARAIGFYGFVKTLAGTVCEYTGGDVSEQQIIALCLILAPENFKNELAVFDESMKEVIQGWLAKCYVEKIRVGRALTTWETVKVCLIKSPYDFSLTLIERAWQQRSEAIRGVPPVSVLVQPPALPVAQSVPSQGLMDQNDYVLLDSQNSRSSCAIL